MSDTTKPMVVWADPYELEADLAERREDTGARISLVRLSGDRAHLLLPIEDGALRVGDHLFQRIGMTDMFRTDDDPEGEWYDVDPMDFWDLLMDAVEGMEP